MTILRLALALFLVLALAPAGAHDVPFRTSCRFDPLQVAFPALGMTGTGATPSGADTVQIVDAPRPQAVQFNAATVPSRALAGLGSNASLALPAAFEARVLASGDFTAADVTLVLTVDGAATTVPVTLTTGLAAHGDVIAEGAPMGPSGMLALVGVATVDGLAAPLGGAIAVFHLSCATAPVPDLDKFPVVELKRFGGRITTKRLRVHAVVDDPGSLAADFPGTPALLRVSTGGTPLVTVDLPAGLAAHGRRKWIGESADGSERVVVTLLRNRPAPRYALALRVAAALPGLPPGRPTVTLVSQVGGLLGRATSPFRGTR